VVEKRPAMPNKGHYRLHKSKSMVRSVFLRQSYTLRIYTKLVPIGETAKGAKAKGRLGLYKVDFKVEEARKVLPGTVLGQCFSRKVALLVDLAAAKGVKTTPCRHYWLCLVPVDHFLSSIYNSALTGLSLPQESFITIVIYKFAAAVRRQMKRFLYRLRTGGDHAPKKYEVPMFLINKPFNISLPCAIGLGRSSYLFSLCKNSFFRAVLDLAPEPKPRYSDPHH
jgi:hypothetical protein